MSVMLSTRIGSGRSIRLIFAIKSDAPVDKIKKLVELTERYCVVFQTLARRPAIEITLEAPAF
jgi:uncharacterized OsmC-like protein